MMTLTGSVFVELRFWLLVVVSVVLPLALFLGLHKRRAISPRSVFWLGLTLVAIAATDVAMMRSLQLAAAQSPSHLDDFLASEVAVGLYLIPALFGGIGIDLISSVFRRHLEAAEHRYSAGRRE
jgi:hypothetical protein